jgi:hypothetical protein
MEVRMDDSRFDTLVKTLALTSLTRPHLVRGLVASAAALAGVRLTAESGTAKGKGKGKGKKKPRKKPVCLCSVAGCTSQKVKQPGKLIAQNPSCNYAGACTTNPCAATVPPLPTAVIPQTCDANTGVSEFVCGTDNQCCPTTSPVCCQDVAPYNATCWPSQYACCNQRVTGGTRACLAQGEQCCAGFRDSSFGGRFRETYCIDTGEECCPFVETGTCNRREHPADQGFFGEYFCCRIPGQNFGRCCPGRQTNGAVEGGCCDLAASDPDAACPDQFFCAPQVGTLGCCLPS